MMNFDLEMMARTYALERERGLRHARQSSEVSWVRRSCRGIGRRLGAGQALEESGDVFVFVD